MRQPELHITHSFVLYQIIIGVIVVVSGVEDAGYASHLNFYMINKALPHRLITDGAIAGNSATPTVAHKDNLAIFLQI